MTLAEFVEKCLALAGFRNLSAENPVVIRVNADTGNEFQIVVSHLEPSFSVLPYNVTWIVADKNSANYKRAMRRVTSLPFAGYRNTWEILTTYEDVFNFPQYYEMSGSFQLGEIQLNGITTATMKVRGTVTLANEANAFLQEIDPKFPVIVGDNDPRMTDAREPMPHSHPLQAAEMLAGASGLNEFFVTIKDSTPPKAGQALLITGAGKAPNEMIGVWRYVNASDVDYAGPTFDDIEIYTSAETFKEQQTYVFRANAKFSDGTVMENVPALWSVVLGSEFSNISATTGTFNSSDVTGNKTVRIQATWTHSASATTKVKTFEFTLGDVTVYRVLQSITIRGDAQINEGASATYSVIANYDDGSTQGIVPKTLLSSNAAAGKLDAVTGVFTASQLQGGNAATTISASYSENGVSKSASFDVVVKDTTVYPVSATIEGADAVNENTNQNYLFSVKFTDGSSRTVSITDWKISNAAAGTIGTITGVLNAGEVNGNQNATITGSFTSEGVTVNAKKDIVVRDLTVYPVSANILGPATVNEGKTATYQLRVNFSDGTNIIVPVADWASNDTTVATINSATGLFTAAADVKPSKATVISASYTSENKRVSDNRSITVVDTTVYPVSAVVVGSPNIDEGTTAKLELSVTFSDGTTATKTAKSWVSSDETIATVKADGTVTVGQVVGNKQFNITGTFEQNGETVTVTRTFTVVDTTSYPVSASIEGPASVNEGVATQYQMSVVFADGSTRTVTAKSWDFSKPAVGTVSSSGLFTPVANTKGNVNGVLTAVYTLDGTTVNASKTVTVVDTTKYPQSAVIEGPASITEGSTGNYKLSVKYSDGTTSYADVDTWAISVGGDYATIAADGLLTTKQVTKGSKDITVTASITVDGVVQNAEKTVTVVDTTVYPKTAQVVGLTSVNEGQVSSYILRVTYTDDTMKEISTGATWSLTDTTGAAIDTTGKLTVNQITGGNKTTTIKGVFAENEVEVTGTLAITLVDTTNYPESAVITGPASFNEGDAATKYKLTVTFKDKSVADMTVSTWAQTNPSAGTLLNDGTFTPAAAVTGADLTTEISASYALDGVTVTAKKTVAVKDTTVYPKSAVVVGAVSVDEGKTSTYALEVTFTDSSKRTVSVNDWAVSNANATIDSAGLLTANQVSGSQPVSVTASYTENGVKVTGKLDITVIDKTVYPAGLVINGPANVTEAGTAQFTATANYTDNSTKTVQPTWSVVPTTYGNVDANGLFTATSGFTKDHAVTVTGTYVENGVTVTKDFTLTVKDGQPYPVSVAVLAPTTMNEGQSSTLQVQVTYNDGSNAVANSGVTWTLSDSTLGTITSGGVFTAAQVSGNKDVTVNAKYVENDITLNGSAVINIKDTTKYPKSIEINGPASVDENKTGSYTATVTYTDNTTAVKTTTSTWSVSGVGSITAGGVYSAPEVSANTSVTIKVSYSEAGVTVTDDQPITVNNVALVPQSVKINGATTVQEKTSSSYTATVTYTNGTTATRTSNGTWGVSSAAVGTITSGGVFTANDVSADTASAITFSYTENGTTVNDALGITVTDVPVNVTPIALYGIAQFSDKDLTGGKSGKNLDGGTYERWTSAQDFFTKVLKNRMPSNTNGQIFSLDLADTTKYGYFAHPSELGTATFTDQSTNYPGGWDGIQWPDGDFGDTTGPLEFTLDDGTGARKWKVYRVDFSGIGKYSWSVAYA